MHYYIYTKSSEAFVQKALAYISTKEIAVELVEMDALENLVLKEGDHLLVTGNVYNIKQVMAYAYVHEVSLGIVPLSEQKELMATFALSSNFEESIDKALKPCEKKIDLLYCDDTLVLQELVIGEVPPLDSFSSSMEKQSLWERTQVFFNIFKKVRHLSHTSFTMTTAKEKVLKFSAVGAVGVQYNNRTFASKLIAKYLKFNDARLSLVILSPSSIFQYMGYIFQSHILKRTPDSLPTSVGYIHSNYLKIEAQKKLTVTIDSERCMQTPIILETKSEGLRLSVGEAFWEKSSKVKEIKESVKVNHLPCDEELSTYLGKSIPLFTHAGKEQFAALFKNLREESQLNSTFMTLLILATMIATFGLYINSASVIIGAMILAPLMKPIVGVSMGILRQDSSLLLSGAKSIGIGVMAVVFSALIIALLLPLEQLTSEMNGRLSPTILDMFVAIISGVAAAYAKSNEKIIGSLAGVAIAVALVPPLAVSGIGLGWGEWAMFSSALLLFITNLVGIILAASLTFLVLGFSPIHVAKKGIFYALTLVAIVSVPLYISFIHMKREIGIQKRLTKFEATIGSKMVHLRGIELQGKELRCEVIASDILSKKEKVKLKKLIADEVGEELKVVVSFWYEL
ncbi:TIGR00341 family protein [bacterium]|nr:TIGR00341 family protein [bacterium]MBU1958806.1 TIGR00341 family protein [bacterium]